ncbi:hypothetical protein [uncultured Sphingomonas sp.]|uniref:hypothetical protein n=1 Tax=uncultured Sphingomonas sp. TaxID=158754 RepID=UPI002587A662|nr:hypothetical protein [uncultured Sphingomonas sp.]
MTIRSLIQGGGGSPLTATAMARALMSRGMTDAEVRAAIGGAGNLADGIASALSYVRSFRPKTGDIVFGVSPYRTVGNSSTTVAYAPASGYVNDVADNFLTAQPEGWRTLFLNFGFNSVVSAGPTAREVLPGNANVIDYAVTFTAASGGGTRAQATFGGQTSVAIPDGGFALTDPRPAFPGGFERVSITTPAGGKRATGWTASTPFGEYRRRNSAAGVPAAASGGMIGGSAPDAARGWKPHATMRPHAGTPSILLLGDSITQQNDFLPTTAMILGGIAKGLADPSNGGPFGVGNFGHHGASMEDFMDVTPGSLRFSQRYAVLAAIRDMNGGRWPMTHIWSQGLRNDFSGIASPTTPEEAFALLKARADAWWAFLATTFPTIPIIQSTVTARVTNGASTNYASLEGQEPRPYTAGIALQWLNDYIMSRPAPLALAVDLRPAQQELRPTTGSQYDGAPVWKRTAFTRAGGGTLVNALAAGTGVTQVTISAATAPIPGTILIFEPGTASMEMRGAIQSVSSNGTTHTVTLTASMSPTYAHAAGSAVASSPTSDGTHPEPAVHDEMAAIVAAVKPQIAAVKS